MNKLLPLTVFLFVLLATQAFGQTDTMLDLISYSNHFLNSVGSVSRNYRVAASSEDVARIGALGGNSDVIDTPLEIALLSIADGVIEIRPPEANVMLPANNPRLADLKLGAAVLQELQLLRFLGDTAAAGRHEAMLQFITGRGNVTRAEVEAFYRNGVRALVSDMVDEQFVRLKNEKLIVPNANALSNIKNALTEFMLAPSVTTYKNLLLTYNRGNAKVSVMEIR